MIYPRYIYTYYSFYTNINMNTYTYICIYTHNLQAYVSVHVGWKVQPTSQKKKLEKQHSKYVELLDEYMSAYTFYDLRAFFLIRSIAFQYRFVHLDIILYGCIKIHLCNHLYEYKSIYQWIVEWKMVSSLKKNSSDWIGPCKRWNS